MHGGSQVEMYYVSPGWRVSVPYDYTGMARDAAGRAITDLSSLRNPDNRVIGAVRLRYLPEDYLPKPATPTAPKKP